VRCTNTISLQISRSGGLTEFAPPTGKREGCARLVRADQLADLQVKLNLRTPQRLTPTEWHLEVLVRNAGKLVTQRQLLQEVWGPQYEKETNYLRVYLAQIRAKLEPDPSRPRYFITQARMGYRFECELRSEQQPLPRSES
jgi:two-component system, OmpR family, KDP operon response regulator KdpE